MQDHPNRRRWGPPRSKNAAVLDASEPSAPMAEQVDWSIEFGHFYALPPGSGRLKAQMREARRTVTAATILRDGFLAQGLSVSTTLMIDDVNETHPWSREEILAAIAAWPLQPDYIAWESQMAPLVRLMPDLLDPEAAAGDCKYLAMAWYLARLGYYEVEPAIIHNDVPFLARKIATVLPARYMLLECGIEHELRVKFGVNHGTVSWTFV